MGSAYSSSKDEDLMASCRKCLDERSANGAGAPSNCNACHGLCWSFDKFTVVIVIGCEYGILLKGL